MELATNMTMPKMYEGLRTGVNGDTLCVHVPGITSDDHCERIAAELYDVGQERPRISRWDVDLSEVPEVTLCLAGALARLQKRLNGSGYEVCFLRTKPAV